MKITDSEYATNNSAGRARSHTETQNDSTSVTVLNYKNKFDSIRLESKINNEEKEKVSDSTEKSKDAETGGKTCDYCDFETAISATGKVKKKRFYSRVRSTEPFLLCKNNQYSMIISCYIKVKALLCSVHCQYQIIHASRVLINSYIS